MLSLRNPEVVHDETQSTYCPPVAGSSDAISSSSFATTFHEAHDSPSTKSPEDTLWLSFGDNARDLCEPLSLHLGHSFEADTTATLTTQYHQDQQSLNRSQPHERSGLPMSGFSFEGIPKPARYYAAALSEQDTQALTLGEKNHNLKKWSSKDLATQYQSRKDLVSRVMPNVEKTNALAGIKHDKQHSQHTVTKVTDKGEEPSLKRLPQASQSAYDLRSTSAPVSQPSSLPIMSLPRPMIVVDDAPPGSRSSHMRAASSGDYFSQRPFRHTGAYHNHPRIPPLACSGPCSKKSVHVGSPLTQQVQFRHNPEVTFDTFLVPHMSGKGETHHDAANAKRPKTPKGSPAASPHVRPKTSRLSRIPSMPRLRR